MSGNRRGIQVFAIAWSVITLLMGASTFVAIYFVYGLVNEPRNINTASSAALPAPAVLQPAAVAQPFATIVPAPPTPAAHGRRPGGDRRGRARRATAKADRPCPSPTAASSQAYRCR